MSAPLCIQCRRVRVARRFGLCAGCVPMPSLRRERLRYEPLPFLCINPPSASAAAKPPRKPEPVQ